MYALNRVQLVGRIGQDAEIKYLENNTPVGRFSIAYSESYKDKNGDWQKRPTEWYDVVVWRNLAERAKTQIKKGKLAFVEGKLKTRQWTDKNGNNRKSFEIVCTQFNTFEDTRNNQSQNSVPTIPSNHNQQQSSNNGTPPPTDDLPF